MTINKSLVRTIFISLSCLFFSITNAKSQILYTDINPDYTFNGPNYDTVCFYNIDINQDSVLDFRFRRTLWWENLSPSSGYHLCESIKIYALHADAKIGLFNSSFQNGPCNNVNIDSGTVINETSLIWESEAGLRYDNEKIHLHCDQDPDKKFIAVKLNENGFSYYGWIRVDNLLTYLDFAINLNPNQSIYTGQIQGREMDYTPGTVTFGPNPVQNILFLNYNLSEETVFEIYNIQGIKIKKFTLENGLSSKIINVDELSNGIYSYSICNNRGEKIKTGKLIVQR